MNWDALFTTVIILSLILIVWAKVSKQTVGEVIVDIKELLFGGGEEAVEKVEGVVMYE